MPRSAAIGALLVSFPLVAAAQEQLAPLPAALPRTHTPQPTTPAITAADLMTRLYIFADDSMRGRQVGTRGNAKGTAYLAAEARRIGLLPAGDSGTYFQNIPGARPVVLDASMRIGTVPLTLVKDFLPIGTHGLNSRALTAVYAGRIDTPITLAPDQVAGKLVVFATPATASVEDLRVPHVAGAAAVAFVMLDSIAPARRATLLDQNMAMTPEPDHPALLLSHAAAKRLFGKDPDALRAGATGQSASIAYTLAQSSRNVVAVLPGSDPALRHEYVALGAHNDHIGWAPSASGDHDSLRVFTHVASIGGAETGGRHVRTTPEEMDSIKAQLTRLRRRSRPRQDSIANGADDDGSGSVSLLEIAERLAALPVKPKRSVLFVWHGGEEAGCLGSTWFTDHPTVPLDSIVVQLNADMIGRGDAWDIPGGGPDYVELVGASRRSTELPSLINRVNAEGRHGLAFDTVTGEQYWNRSDHYLYAEHGIPIAFFITGVHPDYHQVTDEPQYIDYPKLARIASLISDVAVHVADLDHRLASDRR